MSQGAVDLAAQNYIQNHLGTGETFANVNSVQLLGDINDDGMADVRVDYSVNVRYLVGIDPETGMNEYENDTEYRVGTYRLKIK